MKKNSFIIFFLLPFLSFTCNKTEEEIPEEKEENENQMGLWTEAIPFPGSGKYAAAAFTLNNKGYVVGGFSNGSTNEFHVFNILINCWDSLPDFPGLPRFRSIGVECMHTNKGYHGLGMYAEYSDQYLDRNGENIILDSTAGRLWDWWEFTPGNNNNGEWNRLPDFPGPPQHSPIAFCIANKIYVGLGEQKDSEINDQLYIFDTTTNTWESQTITFPGGKKYGSSIFVINNIAYLFGGAKEGNFKEEMYSFDPSQKEDKQWQQLNYSLSEVEEINDHPTLRLYASTFVIDGYGFVTCGIRTENLNDTWKYDPLKNEWEKMASFKGETRHNPVTFSTGTTSGTFLLTGASDSFITKFDDMWNFDPYKNK